MLPFLKTKKSAGMPVTPAVHRLIARGNDARDHRDWDDAAESYREAVTADPTLGHIWVQLGHAEKERRRFGDAEAAYARAALVLSDDADPLLHLGHVYKLVGNIPGAVRAYLRAARLDVSNPHAIEELRHFIAGTAPYAQADLIALLRGAIFGEDDDHPARKVARAAGECTLLLDVSSLVSAVLAGRSFSRAGLVGDRLVPEVMAATDRPALMCAHVTGHGRWLEITRAQFARIIALGSATGGMGPIERQAAITDLDLSFLLSEPLEIPQGTLLVDVDADHAPADHGLFVHHARRSFGARYVAFGAAIAPDLAAAADLKIDPRDAALTADRVLDVIAQPIVPDAFGSTPEARQARVEQLGSHGCTDFRVGTGWLPREEWGSWAVMPGGDMEIAIPNMIEPRLYLRLKALPSERTRYQVALSDGRRISGEIESSQHKWVIVDDLPIADGILKLRIRGEISKLVSIQGAARKLPAMIGAAGFYICEQQDHAARMALLETTTLGDLESLH